MFETIIKSLYLISYLAIALAYILVIVLALLKWSLLASMALATFCVWVLVGRSFLRGLDQ